MFVLASASPRRQELLRNAGIRFVVEATDIREIPGPKENPKDFAERLAREKALAVFHARPSDHVLGADTIVLVDDQILGKPRDAADAARMLRLLAGRSHQVTTAVCLVGSRQSVWGTRTGGGPELRTESGEPRTGFEDVRSETTLVTMGPLSDEEIGSYVATGEPMDKAGAYAIQGMASRWISRIEGDYFNVVGLPVSLVCRMLKEQGVLPDILLPSQAS
jgi:septum formation protein